ncbi:MAG: hypothetical protein JJT95_18660 [Pararhodobacter sp.]|nr:hypothetical protein [Pararhodobacter sp.]
MKQGNRDAVFEAMKLIQNLAAPCSGILVEPPHERGSTVPAGVLLARMTPEEENPRWLTFPF